MGGDARRTARVVRGRGGRRRRVVLRGCTRRPSPGVPARERVGAVAAGGGGDGCARDSRAGRVAGHRHRRFVGRRLLDAVGDGVGSDAREHARGRCCGGSVPSAGWTTDRARAGLGCARARALCRGRDADQRGVRRRLAEVGRCDRRLGSSAASFGPGGSAISRGRWSLLRLSLFGRGAGRGGCRACSSRRARSC